MNMGSLLCRCCGFTFRTDEDFPNRETYLEPPYNWDPYNGYCSACWLMVDTGWKLSVPSLN
jgi:hypothetical protein